MCLFMSTGAADVPPLLWDRYLQRPTLRCLKEGVRQEQGKGHRGRPG